MYLFSHHPLLPRPSPVHRTALCRMKLFETTEFGRLTWRQKFYQILNVIQIGTTALMIWKGLFVLTGSSSPIVVVISGSMEPAYYRGDLLLLTDTPGRIPKAGEAVVFTLRNRPIANVHRTIKVHQKHDGTFKFLTKGDNNYVDDRGLYPDGQYWLTRNDIVGFPIAYLPYGGYLTIMMNDYPSFKYVLLGAMGLMALLYRD